MIDESTRNYYNGIVYSALKIEEKLIPILENLRSWELIQIGAYNEVRGNSKYSEYCYELGLKKALEDKCNEWYNFDVGLYYTYLKKFENAREYLEKGEYFHYKWWLTICDIKTGKYEIPPPEELIKITESWVPKLDHLKEYKYLTAILFAEIGDEKWALNSLKEMNFNGFLEMMSSKLIIHPTLYNLLKDNPEFQEMIAVKG